MEENKSQSKKQSEPQLSEEELTSDSVEESEIEPLDCCNPDCEDQEDKPPRCRSSTPLSEDTENCSNDDDE